MSPQQHLAARLHVDLCLQASALCPERSGATPAG